jgi:hypothetical protein
LEKFRPPGPKFQNIFTAKSTIRDRNQWQLIATGDTRDFPALVRSASLFEACGATSFDKFSTQKRRTEKTAKSSAGDDCRLAITICLPRLQNSRVCRAGVAIGQGYSH